MYIPGTSSIESGFIFSSLNVGLTSQSLQLTFAILLAFFKPVLFKLLPPITILHLAFLDPKLICSRLLQMKVLPWNVTWTWSKQVSWLSPEWSILQSNYDPSKSFKF